jgi:hypothetical protein
MKALAGVLPTFFLDLDPAHRMIVASDRGLRHTAILAWLQDIGEVRRNISPQPQGISTASLMPLI